MAPSPERNQQDVVREKMKHHREERALVERFKNVAIDKLQRIGEEQSLGNGSKLSFGKAELEIIKSLKDMGFKEGFAATVVSFLFLRRGPVYLARFLARRMANASSATSNAPPPMKPPMSSSMPQSPYRLSHPLNNNPSSNPFEKASLDAKAGVSRESQRKSSLLVRGIWFAFDCTLSVMMGAMVSMAYTDVEKTKRQIVELPLVEGRSLVSESLCGEIEAELLKLKQEQNPAYLRLSKINEEGKRATPFSSYLDAITGFVENCQRRRAMEERLKSLQGYDMEHGMSSSMNTTSEMSSGSNSSLSLNERNEPIEIPPPGVPHDGPRMVLNLDGTLETIGGSDAEFDSMNMGISMGTSASQSDETEWDMTK